MNELIQQAMNAFRAGDMGRAFNLCSEALRLNPRDADALTLLGRLEMQAGRPREAEMLFCHAVALNPKLVATWNDCGLAQMALKNPLAALASFDAGLALHRGIAQLWSNHGNALTALRRFDEALASFDTALSLPNGPAEIWNNRANVYFNMRRYEEAGRDYAELYKRNPQSPYALGNLAYCKLHCCDWSTYEQDVEAIAAGIRAGNPVSSPYGNQALCRTAEDQYVCARICIQREYPPQPPIWRGERYGHDKIRVAYLSAELHAHAVPNLIVGVFEHHDRARFETVAMSFGPDEDSAMRARLKGAFDTFCDVAAKSDGEVAAMMRNMEIDIAVDLMGPTAGSRTSIFAMRPAPVQVSLLGFPGTIGADYIDYIVADSMVLPERDMRFYSEQPVFMPDCFMPTDARRVIGEAVTRAQAGLPEQGFIFCSFNNNYKIAPFMFDIWMRLLQAVEGSVLWMPATNTTALRHLRAEATARGVDAGRLIFAPFVADNADHLARLACADLFLDTLPFNAHGTAADALWAGVPVLTCMGETFAGRVAASLVRAVGLPELVMESLAGYEEAALCYARDPQTLGELKTKLARNRGAAPLFDTARYTRQLEAAYTAMRGRAESGQGPQSFAVAAL